MSKCGRPVLLCLVFALVSTFGFPVVSAAELPAGVSTQSFEAPPNEFRLVQYGLTRGALKEYPQWGIGGHMAFYYKNLYKQGPNGTKQIGPLVDAAHQRGRPVWLADDWGYPSGMAGGRVVAENPEFEVRSLVMLSQKGTGETPIIWSLPKNLHDILCAMIYPVKDGAIDLKAGKRLSARQNQVKATGLDGRWELRVFARYTRSENVQAQSTMQQFGHTGRYPDLMNREAMGCFIANMHEPILANIQNPRDKVEGFYCNEPNLMQTAWSGNAPYACAPWSAELPALFTTLHGYDLLSILPYLFEGESDEARRARIHYRQAVAELFTDSFARQIKTWCNKRGIKSSGHYLLNDYLPQHVQGYGDLMKFVSEFDVPGLDIPIPNPDQFQNFRYQQSRFFSSVSAWKERDETLMLLDPIIGGYGKDRLSPEMPLLLNSVNMACFHGVNIFTSYLPRTPGKGAKGYTMEEYRFLNEYVGRLTQVLRGAKRDAGVALYYPIAMFQSYLLASNQRWGKINTLHQKRQQAWDNTEKALLNGDIEYMIVHPEGVAQAQVANQEEGRMKIGDGVYHTMVVPQLDFIPMAAAKTMIQFERDGGKILWVDQVPRGAEHAKHDAFIKGWLKGTKATPTAQLAKAITASFSPKFDLTISPGSNQLAVGRFQRDGKRIYLLVNRLQKGITARVRGEGAVSVLDPSTGKIKRVNLPTELPMEAVRALMLVQ